MNLAGLIILIFLILYILWIGAFVFLERRDPVSTTAWLLVFITFPFIGFIIYYIFGRDLKKKQLFKIYDSEKRLLKEVGASKISKLNDSSSLKLTGKEKGIIDFFNKISKNALTTKNEIDLFTDGVNFFDSYKNDLKKATKEINIEFFIYKKSNLGDEIKKILIDKAKEGVRVRLLLDDLGSKLCKGNYFKELLNNGGDVCFSMPTGILGLRFNNRNHRKITVIDGRVAYIGGFNVGDEYVSNFKKFGFWRDTHIRIVGESVLQLLYRFILDWRNAGNLDVTFDNQVIEDNEPRGEVMVQVVSSGPDSKIPEVKISYLELINKASKSIWIQTPYFVPDRGFLEAIKVALLKGLDVRIMYPEKKDHMFVHWANVSYVGDLLPLGVKGYSYNKGFLHSKMILVDKEILSIGSANLDERSFNLSFETNCFIFDKRIGRMYSEIYIKDIESCHKVTMEEYEKRSFWVKIRETVSRLISPIL